MTAYCVQEPAPHRDLSSAEKFGEVKFLLPANYKPSLTPGPCLGKIHSGLKDFDPLTDYVFTAGTEPWGMMLLGVALRDMGLSEVNFLRWDRNLDENRLKVSEGYNPVKVKFSFTY